LVGSGRKQTTGKQTLHGVVGGVVLLSRTLVGLPGTAVGSRTVDQIGRNGRGLKFLFNLAEELRLHLHDTSLTLEDGMGLVMKSGDTGRDNLDRAALIAHADQDSLAGLRGLVSGLIVVIIDGSSEGVAGVSVGGSAIKVGDVG